MVVESLEEERAQGRSLAFIRPKIGRFTAERKPADQLEDERQKFEMAAKQTDLFLGPIMPYAPCPYRFKYDYETKDGKRTGTCQDCWGRLKRLFLTGDSSIPRMRQSSA